jgi:hypothetical protein
MLPKKHTPRGLSLQLQTTLFVQKVRQLRPACPPTVGRDRRETVVALQKLDDTGYPWHVSFALHRHDLPEFCDIYPSGGFDRPRSQNPAGPTALSLIVSQKDEHAARPSMRHKYAPAAELILSSCFPLISCEIFFLLFTMSYAPNKGSSP